VGRCRRRETTSRGRGPSVSPRRFLQTVHDMPTAPEPARMTDSGAAAARAPSTRATPQHVSRFPVSRIPYPVSR
jgi:hypothetical protein